MKKNITLIGMPSSGKSTIGESLSQSLGMQFIDTDKIIYERENRSLRDIVNTDGLKAFLDIQDAAILEISVDNSIIATGGSVIYGDASMKHLKDISTIVYLQIEYDNLLSRITPERRFARNDGQSFRDLYNERAPLYSEYSDIKINCDNKTVEQIVKEINETIKK